MQTCELPHGILIFEDGLPSVTIHFYCMANPSTPFFFFKHGLPSLTIHFFCMANPSTPFFFFQTRAPLPHHTLFLYGEPFHPVLFYQHFAYPSLTFVSASHSLNPKPFGTLQERSTQQSYAHEFAKLFYMLLRHRQGVAPTYIIPLSPQQITLIDDLYHSLCSNQTYLQAKAFLHPLAYSLISNPPPEALGDRYAYPIIRLICLIHLNHDGSWAPTSKITPNLAKIQWGCRGIVAEEAFQMLQIGNSVSRSVDDNWE